MNSDRLLDAFALIDEAYIAEASPEHDAEIGKRRSVYRYVRWGAIAACVLLCVSLTIPLYQHFFLPEGPKGTPPLDMPNMAVSKQETTEMPGETKGSEEPPATGEEVEIDGETIKEPTTKEPPVEETTGADEVIDDPTEKIPETGVFDETTVTVTTTPPGIATTAPEIPLPPGGHAPWEDLIINPAEKKDRIDQPGNTISYYEGEGISTPDPFDPAMFGTRLGIDYNDFRGKIPAQYALLVFSSRNIVAGKPHDYIFEYHAEDGKHLYITLSAEGAPLWGYQFGSADVPQISSVYGAPVTIYAYGDTLIAQFLRGNVAYELVMPNGSLYDVWMMIAALIS